MSTEKDLEKLREFRRRLRDTEVALGTARSARDQAERTFNEAVASLEELGLDAENPDAVSDWIEKEVAEIDALIAKAETQLTRVQETIRG